MGQKTFAVTMKMEFIRSHFSQLPMLVGQIGKQTGLNICTHCVFLQFSEICCAQSLFHPQNHSQNHPKVQRQGAGKAQEPWRDLGLQGADWRTVHLQ